MDCHVVPPRNDGTPFHEQSFPIVTARSAETRQSMSPAVIANEVRQSMQSEVMDRRVAALLAMTVLLLKVGVRYRAGFGGLAMTVPLSSLRAQRGSPWPRLSLRAQRGNPCSLNSWIATSYLLAMTVPLSSSRGLYSRHCERSTAVHGPGRHCERSVAIHEPLKSWIATSLRSSR
jgi:hypothetical protein